MEKIIYLIAISIFVVSCTSTEPFLESEGSSISMVVDFKKYNDKDFLFSTAPATGIYQTKGLVSLIHFPEIKNITFSQFVDKEIADSVNTEYSFHRVKYLDKNAYTHSKYYAIEIIKIDEVIDSMYEQAIKLGANCVFDLEYQINQQGKGVLSYQVISVSGSATYQERENE